jgi:hypothetical protein
MAYRVDDAEPGGSDDDSNVHLDFGAAAGDPDREL